MKSLWQYECKLPSFESLKGDISTDVLIIGGGIAGILTAYKLCEKGINCVLLEKDRICRKTTAHTTAKITAQHGFIYHKILKSYDKDYAKAYYTAHKRAAEKLMSLCSEAGCNIEIKDNFVYSNDRYKIEKELEALSKIGVPYLYKDNVPLPVKAAGAIGFSNEAQFNPLELINHISQKLRIFENTKVEEMLGTTAKTNKGKVKAKKVVVATHFPFINKHGSYFLKLYQHRSYILALANAEAPKEMFVDNDKKGLSFSSFGELLLLGSGGHRTGKQGGNYNELRQFKDKHYPHSKEVFRWAAQDTISLDAVAYIGNYSKNTPDLYVATGFNKWGMTNSMLSADIISSDILGKPKEYAEVFSPSRCIIKPQLFLNSFESIKNLLTPTTKRCPHLGCALKYNKAEHSWDCPCHGSRFSEAGKILDGPAN
ncbi:MAG: FAD-dependent oxidoreductase [Ruminococcaceae bacterium]|nr:FAD-dependent oxidoreductase [Oscillospiraceae bacterium]